VLIKNNKNARGNKKGRRKRKKKTKGTWLAEARHQLIKDGLS